jgi:hypothetical protein
MTLRISLLLLSAYSMLILININLYTVELGYNVIKGT